MKRLAASSILALAIVVLFGAVLADTKTPDSKLPEPTHFSHADHKSYGISDAEMANCKSCHSIDAKGTVLAPAAKGHAPCLKSGCHGDDPLKTESPSFFAISDKNSKSKDPAMQKAFERASAFCLGCHEQVPWPWKKPTTRVLQGWVSQREHHIEMAKTATSNMDHWAHTQLKLKNGNPVGCRDCHAVDKDHKLVPGAPGHQQCMQCHNPTDNMAFAMTECGRCHKEGSQTEWILGELEKMGKKPKGLDLPSRPKADVRACGTRGAAAVDKRGRPKWKCFKHETPEHRTDKKGEDVQCKKCHWIVADKARWPRDKGYSNLADLHLNKIIGDPTTSDRDKQHKACGGCHPHSKQIELATANCQFCHSERTQEEPYW